MEQIMDDLAEKIGMDSVALRLKNIPGISQGRNWPYTTSGLKECIEKGAEQFGWEKAVKQAKAHNQTGTHIKRGVGMGSCVWFVGVGYRGSNPANRSVNPFAAQFCELEVNTKTGEMPTLVMPPETFFSDLPATGL